MQFRISILQSTRNAQNISYVLDFQVCPLCHPTINQLDATSKVMYRHEIICAGNKAYLIKKYLFRDNAAAASLGKIRK